MPSPFIALVGGAAIIYALSLQLGPSLMSRDDVRREYLYGHYIYGVACYAILGAASIAWAEKEALAIVLVGAGCACITYRCSAISRFDTLPMHIAAAISWVAPSLAAFMITYG